MTAHEVAEYLPVSEADYFDDIVRAWKLPVEAARAKVERDFAAIREHGAQTDDETVFVVERASDGAPVGMVWLACEEQDGQRTAFIYDIRIEPAHRRSGFGRATLDAVEAWGRERGAERVGLHVFGDNAGARALYAEAGFIETSIRMIKVL